LRILLLSLNTLKTPYPVYPLGLDYVAGSLSAHHQVKIADMNTLSLAELENLLRNYSPEVIGLSCRNIDNVDADDPRLYIEDYRNFVLWLKKRSGAVLVCGGSGFSIMADRIFAALGVDYGIIGEGERFGLLVDLIEQGQDPVGIPGLISSSHPPRVPAAAWAGTSAREFQGHAPHVEYYLKNGGMLNLQSKRGCSFQCIYCPYPNIEGKKHRLMRPEEVAQTAIKLQAAGAKYIFITDSAFNSDIPHSLAVARAFKTAGLSIPWGGFFAPLRLPADYFANLADAGLHHVEFGTESMSAAMLAAYRKPFSVPDVFLAHRQAQEAGLNVAHYFLMGGPGESAATIQESLSQIEKLDRTVLFFFVGIRIYPRTALYDIALKEGKITLETDLLEPIFYDADDITREGIAAMLATQARNRPNWIIGSGGAMIAASVKKMYERGHTGPLWEFLAR
jgi:radical SAM superfamily enzyme YgiQ (UPF0313 family)